MAAALDPIHAAFAKRVQQLMAAKKLSVNMLADFSGIGRGRLSEILRGRSSPTLRTVAKIAAALDTTVQDLFRGI